MELCPIPGTLGYFAEYGAFAQLSAQQQKNHMSLAPSAGTYGYEPHVTYFFGIPRTIELGGVVMDLDRVANITNTDGKGHDAWKDFNFQLGGLSSALEHGIPEQMFVNPENPGEAVSAVKALAKATQQGQRIYHITPANQATVLPNIHHNDLTMSEIRNALSIGKEVITHTDAISVPRWSGAGYVIFDPNTGDGAWKIGGGENGGWIILAVFFMLAIIALLPLIPLFAATTVSFLSATLASVTEFLVFLEALDFRDFVLVVSHSGCADSEKEKYLKNEMFLYVTELAFGWFLLKKIVTTSSEVEVFIYELWDTIVLGGVMYIFGNLSVELQKSKIRNCH